MKDFQQTEKFMMRDSRNSCAEYDEAYRNVLKVYRFYDNNSLSNHCEIINYLYNSKNNKLTLEGVADKAHINDNTLRRYRRKYTAWFKYFLETSDDEDII